MKKMIFYMVLFSALALSGIGIYGIESKRVEISFLSENIIGILMTIAFFQLVYLYATRSGNKVYADIPMKDTSNIRNNHKSSVRLEDVAGLEEVKEEIMEIIDFINNAEKYKKMGAKVPKGIIFYGPPGTGKTLLASALAGETKTGFLIASGSEFIEKYVGVGAKRIRELFAKARKEAPCIVFIDEIDAIGGTRSNEGQSEGNQTLNQLLTEMDGFKQEKEDKLVIVIGATNRLDILDSALLRPGRFDKHIYIGNPNRIAREQILKVHTRNKPLDASVNLQSIAVKTHGLSGAHISNIANEAAILAVRHERQVIIQEDFDGAIERVIAGLKIKNSTVGQNEKRMISYHEAGHALIGKILGNHDIEKISIIPTGQALGYVLNTASEDKYLYTKSDLYKKIQSLLGGRAAEEIVFGEVTTGARDDLHKATDIVLGMICEYGMSTLGNRSFDDRMIQGNLGQINEEVKKIIDTCYKETIKMLESYRECLNKIAEYLLENETLTGEELENFISQHEGLSMS